MGIWWIWAAAKLANLDCLRTCLALLGIFDAAAIWSAVPEWVGGIGILSGYDKLTSCVECVLVLAWIRKCYGVWREWMMSVSKVRHRRRLFCFFLIERLPFLSACGYLSFAASTIVCQTLNTDTVTLRRQEQPLCRLWIRLDSLCCSFEGWRTKEGNWMKWIVLSLKYVSQKKECSVFDISEGRFSSDVSSGNCPSFLSYQFQALLRHSFGRHRHDVPTN